MISTVFLKTLRDMRKGLIWWVIGMFLYSLYMMSFYPSIQKSSADMQEYLDKMPDSFMAMMGGEIDLNSVEGFLSMEVFSFMYPFLALAFGVTYGAGFIGNEEERGTLDLLLSTPVPRWRVVLEKFGALIVFTLAVVGAAYLGFIVGGVIAGVDDLSAGAILRGMLNLVPMTLFFSALALCLTGIKSGRGLALGGVLGVAAITYLTYTMADLADIPLWLQRLSPWYYYNGAHVLKAGLNGGDIALLLGLTAGLVGLAMWGFERRDVGV